MSRNEELRQLTNEYPPLKGAGIEITYISDDFTTIKVMMKLTEFNKNIVNSHFGGSLYAMCDPFFMFILMEKLGNGYMVWDKEATIKFLQPGRTDVFAEFIIPIEKIESIKEELENGRSHNYEFYVNVTDVDGQIIAEVKKLIYTRKMRSKDYENYKRNPKTLPTTS
jgi:acyl-coenzyme A thioesterase PaaI-like protein